MLKAVDPRILYFLGYLVGVAGIFVAAIGSGLVEVLGIVLVVGAGITCLWAQRRIAHLGGREWNPGDPRWWRGWNDMDRRDR
jgi:steroid 5-alpha reductase family enzyme